jgi:hypothetical protein
MLLRGLGETWLARALLVCLLVLGLELLLAVAAVGSPGSDLWLPKDWVRARSSIGTQPDGDRLETAGGGAPLTPTDAARVYLPSVFQASETVPSILTERQRFGFVAVSDKWADGFDVDQLKAGWYVDATIPPCSVAPAGTERALLVQVHAGYTVDLAWLGPQVDRHARTMWLIGNEPDCIWQDNVVPEEYARIYHDLYTFIKLRDPTSRISPGGIVQPSPLRLEWLSRVLDAYRSEYGEDMPVDLWNIHNGILPEKKLGWGAEIPPGIDATQGVLRDIQDNDNLEIFEGQVWAFRQWMADNGYAGQPLVVSEYGILMPELYGFDVDRVNRFMSATFDFFQNATDPELGDPSDEYRLVQRWAWFSLDIPPYDPDKGGGFNGNLFDPETRVITDFGLRFASRAGTYPALSTVDLAAALTWSPPVLSPVGPTETVTRTMLLDVRNGGNQASGLFTVTLKYDGPVSGVINQVIGDIAPGSSVQLSFVVTDLEQGGYDIEVQIDPEDRVLESTECNNEILSLMVIPSDVTFLPMVVHGEP